MNEIIKKNNLEEKKRGVEALKASLTSTPFEYRETSDINYDRLDLLGQLAANVAQIEDLHGRLSFVMNEVQSVMRRR